MAEADNGFRTALVGGFQRDDVLRYIEDAARRHAEETAALKEKLDEAERRAKEQSARADSLTEKNAELLERLGRMTVDLDKAVAEREERERSLVLAAEETNIHTERYNDLKAQFDALEDECARLRAENERLQARSDEYAAARDHLAEIELCAHRRAQQLEEQAQQHAAKIETDAEKRVAEMKREMDKTREEYRETLRRTQQAADEARRRTEEILSRLGSTEQPAPAAAQANRKAAAEPEKHSALDEMLKSVKPGRP